jgi:hypothetical protein
MKFILSCVLVLLCVSVRPSHAQVCAGAPSFRDNPFQGAVTAAFTEGARGFGGSFSGGGESIFGGAGVSVLNFSDLDTSATRVSVGFGADLQADQNGRVFLCPVGQVAFGVGPDVGAIEISTITLSGGGQVGVLASETDTLMVVPTFGVFALRTRVTAELAGSDTTETDRSGLASVGVGFVFNRNVAVKPAVSIPFSVANADAVFSIELAFSFGS